MLLVVRTADQHRVRVTFSWRRPVRSYGAHTVRQRSVSNINGSVLAVPGPCQLEMALGKRVSKSKIVAFMGVMAILAHDSPRSLTEATQARPCSGPK